jgi:hypothetical protein
MDFWRLGHRATWAAQTNTMSVTFGIVRKALSPSRFRGATARPSENGGSMPTISTVRTQHCEIGD